MISIISGTNRPGNKTLKVAELYKSKLEKKAEKVQLFNLEDLPKDFCGPSMYNAEEMSDELKAIQDKYFLAADKIIIVSPEYNGCFPGVLKTFLDAISVREYKATFSKRKFGLVGVASGKAGNLFGMCSLTIILNHVGSYVFPNKLPISSIEKCLDEAGNLDTDTNNAIESHIEAFLSF